MGNYCVCEDDQWIILIYFIFINFDFVKPTTKNNKTKKPLFSHTKNVYIAFNDEKKCQQPTFRNLLLLDKIYVYALNKVL